MLSLDALAGLGFAGSSLQVGDRSALSSQVNLAAPIGARHFAQRIGEEGAATSSGFGGGRPSLEEVLMKRCQQQIAAIAAAAPSADGVDHLPFLSRNLPASTWEHPDARKLLGQDRFAHPLLSSASSFDSSMRNGRKRGLSAEEVPNLPSLFDDSLGMAEAKRTRTDCSDLSMPLAQEDSQSQLQAQAMLDDFAGAAPHACTTCACLPVMTYTPSLVSFGRRVFRQEHKPAVAVLVRLINHMFVPNPLTAIAQLLGAVSMCIRWPSR